MHYTDFKYNELVLNRYITVIYNKEMTYRQLREGLDDDSTQSG